MLLYVLLDDFLGPHVFANCFQCIRNEATESQHHPMCSLQIADQKELSSLLDRIPIILVHKSHNRIFQPILHQNLQVLCLEVLSYQV